MPFGLVFGEARLQMDMRKSCLAQKPPCRVVQEAQGDFQKSSVCEESAMFTDEVCFEGTNRVCLPTGESSHVFARTTRANLRYFNLLYSQLGEDMLTAIRTCDEFCQAFSIAIPSGSRI